MGAVLAATALVLAAVVYGLTRTGGSSRPTTLASPGQRPELPMAAPTRAAPSGTPAGPGVQWTLRFDDEFNSDSLDSARWNSNWLGPPGALTPPVNSDEEANYSPANVSVSGGYLHLAATAQPSTIDGKTRPYTSAIVNTAGLFQFQYGYAEARVYVPGSDGKILNWPSFWTVGNGPWPVTGEDDIFEGGYGHASYHFASSQALSGAFPSGNYTGWHTFASDWEPGSVTYYIDGVQVGRITKGISSAPMYLVLNLAVGGGYSGPVSVPSTMLVDYVRVWQH